MGTQNNPYFTIKNPTKYIPNLSYRPAISQSVRDAHPCYWTVTAHISPDPFFPVPMDFYKMKMRDQSTIDNFYKLLTYANELKKVVIYNKNEELHQKELLYSAQQNISALSGNLHNAQQNVKALSDQLKEANYRVSEWQKYSHKLEQSESSMKEKISSLEESFSTLETLLKHSISSENRDSSTIQDTSCNVMSQMLEQLSDAKQTVKDLHRQSEQERINFENELDKARQKPTQEVQLYSMPVVQAPPQHHMPSINNYNMPVPPHMVSINNCNMPVPPHMPSINNYNMPVPPHMPSINNCNMPVPPHMPSINNCNMLNGNTTQITQQKSNGYPVSNPACLSGNVAAITTINNHNTTNLPPF